MTMNRGEIMEYLTILNKCISVEAKKRKAMSRVTLTAFERDSTKRLEDMDKGEKMLKEVFQGYRNIINELYEENEAYEQRLSELE